jgi:predicted DNA-binding transcriptional regulator AlpA
MPDVDQNTFLPGPKVCARYDIRDITLLRWMRDAELEFPQPLRINRRNYWRLAELERWERARARASRHVAERGP